MDKEKIIFNIDPNYIKINRNEIFYYDFLKFIKDKYNINITNYYYLINSLDEFKLKNIYQFIYLRLLKINKKFKEIDKLESELHNLKRNEFNNLLKEYINNDLIKSIIIINSIQQYFFPIY